MWLRSSCDTPEMRELHSRDVNRIMGELELSANMDTETLREWLLEIQTNPKLLKGLLHPIK